MESNKTHNSRTIAHANKEIINYLASQINQLWDKFSKISNLGDCEEKITLCIWWCALRDTEFWPRQPPPTPSFHLSLLLQLARASFSYAPFASLKGNPPQPNKTKSKNHYPISLKFHFISFHDLSPLYLESPPLNWIALLRLWAQKRCTEFRVWIWSLEAKMMTMTMEGMMEKGALDDIIRRLVEGKGGKQVQLSESEIRQLCVNARQIFLSQPILLPLHPPIIIAGHLSFF